MKALSIRQPWLWAILHAGKDVENRDWKDDGPNMREARRLQNSDILLHASAGMTRAEYADYLDTVRQILHPRAIAAMPEREALERGGIVGRARLAGIVHERMQPESYGRAELVSARKSKWFFGSYGLVLQNAKPFEFIPFKGALGFFDVPDDLVREAMAA